MRLALLSGAFRPQFDGISDYSWWLSQILAEQGPEVTVPTNFAPVRQPAAGVDVQQPNFGQELAEFHEKQMEMGLLTTQTATH